jgi:hypothetical protein
MHFVTLATQGLHACEDTTVGWVSEAKATIAAQQQTQAKLERDVVNANAKIERLKIEIHAASDLVARVAANHGGEDNFQKYLQTNYSAGEIKQIEKNPMLMRIGKNAAGLFESLQTALGELQETKDKLNSNAKILRAVLERCYHRVNVHDIEGLENYRP